MKSFSDISSSIDHAIEQALAQDLEVDSSRLLPVIHPAEKRKFERREINRDKNLQIRFRSEAALARSYIQDISLGGIFLKTEERPALKTIMTIDLQVDQETGEPERIELQAVVVRHASDGIGLEFTNLDSAKRQEIEKIVQLASISASDLNKGRVKAASFQQLSEIRKSKAAASLRLKKHSLSVGIVALLLGLNLYAARDFWSEAPQGSTTPVHSRVALAGREIRTSDIRRIERTTESALSVWVLGSDTPLVIEMKDVRQLPKQWQDGIRAIKSQAKAKKRVSKTAPHRTRVGQGLYR